MMRSETEVRAVEIRSWKENNDNGLCFGQSKM